MTDENQVVVLIEPKKYKTLERRRNSKESVESASVRALRVGEGARGRWGGAASARAERPYSGRSVAELVT